MFPNSPITATRRPPLITMPSFEIALHVNTNCADFTPSSLQATFTTQFNLFASTFPGARRR